MKSLIVLLSLTAFVAVQAQFDCPAPNCSDADSRRTLWPHEKPTFFYRCEFKNNVWSAVEQNCPCDNLFSFIGRGCVRPADWIRVCNSHAIDAKPDSCGSPVTTSAATTSSNPTVQTVAA